MQSNDVDKSDADAESFIDSFTERINPDSDVVTAQSQHRIQIWVAIFTAVIAVLTYLAISATLFFEHRNVYRKELDSVRSLTENTSNKVDAITYKLLNHFEKHEEHKSTSNEGDD